MQYMYKPCMYKIRMHMIINCMCDMNDTQDIRESGSPRKNVVLVNDYLVRILLALSRFQLARMKQ